MAGRVVVQVQLAVGGKDEEEEAALGVMLRLAMVRALGWWVKKGGGRSAGVVCLKIP